MYKIVFTEKFHIIELYLKMCEYRFCPYAKRTLSGASGCMLLRETLLLRREYNILPRVRVRLTRVRSSSASLNNSPGEYISITAKSKLVSSGVTSKLAKIRKKEHRALVQIPCTPFAASIYSRGARARTAHSRP